MKNNTINIFYLVLFAGVALVSCTKEEVQQYQDAPSINLRTSSDTVSVSFDLMPKDDSVFSFPLNVMGYPVGYDRQVKVEPAAGTTATAGVHFDILECVIRANTVLDTLKLVVHKTEDVTETNFKYITIQLVPTSDFKAGATTRVTIALKAGLPSVWSEDWLDNFYCELAYGLYSKEKFRFIMRELGTPDVVEIASDYSTWDALKLFLNARLDAWEAEHGPLMDENDSKVTFPL